MILIQYTWNQLDPSTTATTGVIISLFTEENNGLINLMACGLLNNTTAPNAPTVIQSLRSNNDSL